MATTSYVTTGFSKPYVAKYANASGNVTYSGGMLLGRGVNVSAEIDTADDNNFYADNIIAETESTQFTSGSLTVTVDGLGNDAATLILGLPATEALQVGDSPGTTVQMQHYGKDLNAPYVGFGYVRRVMYQGVTSYIAMIHPKVKFSLPSDSAATQEDQIDWQTQELSATLMRDDTAKADWKLESELLDTEAEAEAVIKQVLNITAAAMSLQAKATTVKTEAK